MDDEFQQGWGGPILHPFGTQTRTAKNSFNRSRGWWMIKSRLAKRLLKIIKL
jgi:hypothetical protein